MVETHVLSRLAEPGHRMHQPALDVVQCLVSDNHKLHIVPRNRSEFWVVCARPTAVKSLGKTAAGSAAALANIKGLFVPLDERPTIYSVWESLVSVAERLMPSGYCFCVCGGETKVGAFFLPGHDKRAEAAVIEINYGTVVHFLQAHGYGPGGVNLQHALRKQRGQSTTAEGTLVRPSRKPICFATRLSVRSGDDSTAPEVTELSGDDLLF